MLATGIALFLTGSGSRNHYGHVLEEDSGALAGNLRCLCGEHLLDLPTPRAVDDLLLDLPHTEVAGILPEMIDKLLRSRVLERFRLFGRYYTLAIDGTGYASFDRQHCPFCLHQEHDDFTCWYHTVLAAKLVTPNGMALSVSNNFIENSDPNATKQDCEQKAFPRLARQLHSLFPRLPVCLLLDGGFANQNVIRLCRELGWEFIITFKEGSLPEVFDEFHRLQRLNPTAVLEQDHEGRYQRLAWVNDLRVADQPVHAADCLTHNGQGDIQYFAWLASFPLGAGNVAEAANQGGRQRWRIENEGFWTQKHGGFALEHLYSNDLNAQKNYYLLLQIAHFLLQLLKHGRLGKVFRERIKTLKYLFCLLTEHLRTRPPTPEGVAAQAAASIQIRFDSS